MYILCKKFALRQKPGPIFCLWSMTLCEIYDRRKNKSLISLQLLCSNKLDLVRTGGRFSRSNFARLSTGSGKPQLPCSLSSPPAIAKLLFSTANNCQYEKWQEIQNWFLFVSKSFARSRMHLHLLLIIKNKNKKPAPTKKLGNEPWFCVEETRFILCISNCKLN